MKLTSVPFRSAPSISMRLPSRASITTARRENVADVQGRIQRAGKTYRMDQRGTVQRDHRFGGAARRLHADAAADDDHFILLKENKAAALVALGRTRRPSPSVRPLTSRSSAATMATLGIAIGPEPLHCTAQSAVRGYVFHPSSRSALSELAHIFFFPMRTVSMVARGSRPSRRPETVSSTAPAA